MPMVSTVHSILNADMEYKAILSYSLIKIGEWTGVIDFDSSLLKIGLTLLLTIALTLLSTRDDNLVEPQKFKGEILVMGSDSLTTSNQVIFSSQGLKGVVEED